MKSISFKERGQALVLITLAAIGLFAIVGLAIDGSAKFSDRRHAQNAADTAALTAALGLVNNKIAVCGVGTNQQWQCDALAIADKNGYNRNLVTNRVWVYKCNAPLNDPLRVDSPVDCGPYNNNESYVQVVIVSRINTYFARVVGINQTVNTVNAVTLWAKKGPAFGPELLKSLNNNPCNGSNGNIVFGGNGDITLNGGGAYINSPGGTGSCGMEYSGCGNLTVIGGSLTTVGGGNINVGSTSSNCSTNVSVPAPSYNYNPGFPFPPEMPKVPSECTSPLGSWTIVSGVTYLNPGKYYDFPPKNTVSQPVTDNIFMNPGTYCVDNVVKLQDRNLVLNGHDVTIYIKPANGQFDVQGGTIHLDGPDTGPYAGYLIIINSDFTGVAPTCSINGNSTNVYIGTIFAPYCNFVFNGTNESGDPALTYNTQVVAYTITLTGNSDINFTYNPSEVAQSAPKVGMMR